jgi:hypothetical protein
MNSVELDELDLRDSPCGRGMTWSSRIGWVPLLCLVSVVSATCGQARFVARPPVTVNPKISQAPMSHLYRNFLLYQNHLDRAAADRESHGQDGSGLRNLLQVRLGFTSAEFSIVRAKGLRLESELKDVNTRMMTAANQYRASSARASLQTQVPLIAPAALNDLVKEREDLLQQEMEDLNRQLGPEASAKLQSVVEQIFSLDPAQHRIVRPKTPAHFPTQPSQPKVQP